MTRMEATRQRRLEPSKTAYVVAVVKKCVKYPRLPRMGGWVGDTFRVSHQRRHVRYSA